MRVGSKELFSTSKSNHSTLLRLLLNRALKRQAPCLYMHFEVRALDRLRVRTRRCVGSTRRRGNHMHDHSRFQRDINDVTGVSLSLPLTKVTDAQYRKRFRASYNRREMFCKKVKPQFSTMISGVWCRAIHDRPQRLLRVLIMLIMIDFAALRAGTGSLRAR